jgi:hypothetical protein
MAQSTVLDIFKQDAFSFISLTQSINKLPHKPARCGELGIFQDKGVTTIDVFVEERNGLLTLIPTATRGAQAASSKRSMRSGRTFRIPHIPFDDEILAGDVQGVRAFGSDNQVMTVVGLVNERLTEIRQAHEVTLEWHRMGALQGKIIDADSTTKTNCSTIYNLFEEFGLGDTGGTNQAKLDVPGGYTYGYTNGSSNSTQAAALASNDMNTAGYKPEFGEGQSYLDIGTGTNATSLAVGGNRYLWNNTYGTNLECGQHGYVFLFSDPTLKVRSVCTAIIRDISKTLGQATYDHIHAFCGSNFFDKLIDHDDVRATYYNWTAAADLRKDIHKTGFDFGGITWENYQGKVSGNLFQDGNAAIIFPIGVPNLFNTYYAPADFVETVNTVGIPLYAKQEPLPFNKGIKIHTQSNPLAMCCRPLVLIKGVCY